MLDAKLADKLSRVASKQLAEGLRAKKKRMDILVEINDLYNNKTIELNDAITNIPFPILAGQVDLLYSKIDNPPTLTFKIPNKATLSDKVQAAWVQESSSTRAGWQRKDRALKKMAILTGRTVAKVYASSVNNQYQSHLDVVDIYSFVCDPTRGFLEEGNYHGETDIFKTNVSLKLGAEAGVYSKAQVAKLNAPKETMKDGQQQVVQNKFNRLKALGIDVETTSFAGQEGVNLTEWIMRYEGTWYYLLFEPNSQIWVRAELLSDIFKNGKTPYVSWATHYDEYNYWSKGPCDDAYPIAEAIRLILNNAIENDKRRTRPMRIVDAGALMDVNELQDYVPDNVILRNAGKDPNIITVETPEISASINLATFLDTMIQNKSGVADPGVDSTDPKVGVYYGKLQQEADRIGTINKEYSECYAHMGYRFFWGLKQHLTATKQVEMLGKTGIKLQQLSKVDFKDVDDVDDVLVSGGSQEQEMSAVQAKQKAEALQGLVAAFPQQLNPKWVIRTTLKNAGFDDEDMAEAMDAQASLDRDQIEEADQAIQDVLLGNMPPLNQGAGMAFVNRIIDYARTELNWVLLDKNGNESGKIDEKMKEHFDKLLAYVNAHQRIVMDNMNRDQQRMQMASMLAPQGNLAVPGDATQQEQNQQLAQPNEPMTPVAGTPSGTASASQQVSSMMR